MFGIPLQNNKSFNPFKQWSSNENLLSTSHALIHETATLVILLVTSFLVICGVSTVADEIHTTATTVPITSVSNDSNSVPLGSVIHLFPRYGYLSLSMRVVPRNDSLSWLFLEPIRHVFENSTMRVEERHLNTIDYSIPNSDVFHMSLCENTQELVQAYFHRFTVQGLDKPWQAYSGGWRAPSLSKYFGIAEEFIKGDYRYLLMQVIFPKRSGQADPLANISVVSEFQEEFVRYGELGDKSMYHFSNNVGTHYVHSYIVGNSMYQVLVYSPYEFELIKQKLKPYFSQPLSPVTVLPSITPEFPRQVGNLFLLNFNQDTLLETLEKLTVEMYPNVFIPTLLKFQNDPTLINGVADILANEPSGLLAMDLRTIDIGFQNEEAKVFFLQSLKHMLQLWEQNF